MTLDALREEFERGVADQIAVADRALAVADALGEVGSNVPFRGLLYHILVTQADSVVVALGKLFDSPPGRHETRSIRGFLKLLEDHAQGLQVYDRGRIEETVQTGDGDGAEETCSAPELTRSFVQIWRARLKPSASESISSSVQALERIRARRNKQVAHNENWTPDPDERASWDDAREALRLAKEFACDVGPAYLAVQYEDADGAYMPTKSSQMIGEQARRMLSVLRDGLEGGDVS